ncbi:MAG: type VI secretion system tip protein TssI/VgrG [Hyphomicrobiales bacterium]|nr:type VI secretion system tip protein TssI/VgrG [Hyphomicrobiales bacterium]
MNKGATQSHRLAELKTPLGKDKFLLKSFKIHEAISELFTIDIDCISEDKNVDISQIIGKQCSIRFETVSKKERYFSGVLVEASWFGEIEGLPAYRLMLRPWLWLLTQTSDCRIFQNLSVIDIIKKVFDDLGLKDYENKTRENYSPIEYCVQYRETSFNFVSRLMEKFGIYYHFKHERDRHIMVLCDSNRSHEDVPDLPQCRFVGLGDRTRDTEESVTTWQVARALQTGKVTLNGYDFKSPKAKMIHEQSAPGGYAHDSLEIYDYPEKYKVPDKDDLGKMFAQARLFASQSLDQRRHATGNAPSLYPGGVTRIVKHPAASENTEFLVVSATHAFHGEQFRSGAGGGGGTGPAGSYSGSYQLQPMTRPFKASSVTPHPVIAGPQTAVVVGKGGEEIHTDKFGRIKIKFHWDRIGKDDDSASRWVRVAQTWASKSWGGIIIPRVGMEVVVEFIEGDPDRPLVVGTVYNGDNGVPYDLPSNQTQSGFKTRSSKNGHTSNYNELVFEDKKDAEFVRFHAEKDLDSTIEDKEKRLIKGKNKKDAGETTRETTIEKGDDVLSVKVGDHHSEVGRHQTVSVGVNQSVAVGSNQSVTAGAEITIEAGVKLTLIVGQSKITMTPTGIEIKTPSLNTKSSFTEISADVSIIEKATIIKLN